MRTKYFDDLESALIFYRKLVDGSVDLAEVMLCDSGGFVVIWL